MSKPLVRKDVKSGLYYRPDTIDDYIIREASGYDVLKITKEDRVLDVGGCIGSFAARAAFTGAEVVSYEPHPENYMLLCLNSPKSKNVHAALTREPLGFIELYANVGKNKGLHSTTPHRGRDVVKVPAIPMMQAMNELRPTVVKMDCEGAEYDLLTGLKFDHVDRIAIEWHLTKPLWRSMAPDYHQRVLDRGYHIVKGSTDAFVGKTWATVIVYKRN